jgi:hypothetical protein
LSIFLPIASTLTYFLPEIASRSIVEDTSYSTFSAIAAIMSVFEPMQFMYDTSYVVVSSCVTS